MLVPTAKSSADRRAPCRRLIVHTVAFVDEPDEYINIVVSDSLDSRTSTAAVGTYYVSITTLVVHGLLRCRLNFFTIQKN